MFYEGGDVNLTVCEDVRTITFVNIISQVSFSKFGWKIAAPSKAQGNLWPFISYCFGVFLTPGLKLINVLIKLFQVHIKKR